MTQANQNKEFELRGVNHLALVCKDMARTVEFYTEVLGMPMTKTIDLPGGMGQHFFFDIGKGDSLAFFWFPDAPEKAPGIAAPSGLPGQSLTSAHGSMNHVAFDVPEDKIEEYRERLLEKGIEVTEIINHDNSPMQATREMHDGVFVRSLYFRDPDGILLEFACWTAEFTEADVAHKGATWEDRHRYLAEQKKFFAQIEEMRKTRES
jgi:catechol 2,3-dioxygenase-like lactoylglutathione lyase family enzyme